MSDTVSPMIDPQALGKLKWRCRRGLLENDLLIERFFLRQHGSVNAAQARGLERLMELPDNDLLDLLLRRTEPGADLEDPEIAVVLALLRNPQAGRSPIHDSREERA